MPSLLDAPQSHWGPQAVRMPSVQVHSWTAPAPALTAGTLNRAEWVKFLGLFFNKEKEASQYFDTVERQYNRLKVGIHDGLTAPVNEFEPTSTCR
jgi:hypothetical protein